MTQEERAAIEKAQGRANIAKERLMEIVGELESIGAFRKARSLETIIIRLETWQNTK